MNNKGVSPITVFFWVLTFVILWFMFLGDWLNTWGVFTVTHNNLTGFAAFFYHNLNILIFVALVIFILAYSVIGGDR